MYTSSHGCTFELFVFCFCDFRELGPGLGLNYITFIMFGLVKINILKCSLCWACWDVLEFMKIGRKSIYKHWLVSSGNPGGRLNQFTEFIVIANSLSHFTKSFLLRWFFLHH